MKKSIMLALIIGLCATWAFAANDAPVNLTSEPVQTVKTEQPKTTKPKVAKKNMKGQKSKGTKKAENRGY